MTDQLVAFLQSLRTNPKVSGYDEIGTKQAVILPLLHLLGWNVFNIEEVAPEFSVSGRRVDFCLRLGNINEVFLEVKKTGSYI